MPNISRKALLKCAELAKLILKIRPELPVVLATGYSTTINPDKAKSIGIREMLLKPNKKSKNTEISLVNDWIFEDKKRVV